MASFQLASMESDAASGFEGLIPSIIPILLSPFRRGISPAILSI
jgi:hypothetical protein